MLCSVDHIYVSHAYFYQYRQARMGAITSVVKPKGVWDTVTILVHALQEREKYQDVPHKREYLSYRAAQHYLNIMFKSEVLNKEEKRKMWRILGNYRQQCVPYLCGTLGNLAKMLIGIFGIPNACVMLQSLRRIVRTVKNL